MDLERITPIKALGQNFLKDKNLANKIVNLLGELSEKTIVEIGPGMGALTDILLAKNANVIAIDKDLRACEHLTKKYGDISNFRIINDDIRKVNLYDLIDEEISVIGNIPYNISTDILFWTFDFSDKIKQAIFTVQKEVAERICAKSKTKDYGVTTIATKLYGQAKIAFHIPPSAFFPPPKVTSSVLKIDFQNQYENVDKKEIMRLVKALFVQRRKMINNSIKSYISDKNLDIKQVSEVLTEQNLNYLKQRPEALEIDDFISLYKILTQMQEKD